MNQSEINRELENLTNQFRTMVSSHFNSSGIEVNLEYIDFSILHKFEKATELGPLLIEGNLLTYKTFSRCRKNPQGQIVCD